MRIVRRRTEQDPPPKAEPRRADPPPAPSTEAPAGQRGAAAAIWGLVQRKLHDLRGHRWETASRSERDRAARQYARTELANRIEAQTGKRPSERTLRRHIAAGTAPRGVDADRLERQAAIDSVGSIDKFARSRGITTYAVRKWRDTGGELPDRPVPESLRFHVAIVATLMSKGARYKHDEVYTVEIVVSGESVIRIAEAVRTGDYAPVTEMIAELACTSFEWVGSAQREFVDAEVIDVSLAQ